MKLQVRPGNPDTSGYLVLDKFQVLVCWGFCSCFPNPAYFMTDPRQLHSFPGATVTNDCRQGGLKPQQFVLSQFWRPETRDQGSAGLVPSKAGREDLFRALPASGGH